MPTWHLKPFCRRRFKTFLISTIALSFLGLLILHSQSQKDFYQAIRNQQFSGGILEESEDGPPYLLGSLETLNSPVETKHALYQSFEDEVKAANYHTNDLFNTFQSDQQPKGNRAVPTNSKEKLEVFLLPFTHVDPGWLRTFDSYSQDTDNILTNMHDFMIQDKNKAMRFLWAEFVFFERWWAKQNETVKKGVKKLVTEGRVELASGSWVMTDEANAYFPVSVDNIVEGHQYLQHEFGKVPSTIWSNDPFGYSHSVPYLFAKAGVKRNVINRIHHPMKRWLQSQKAIPFHWRQYFDKDGNSDVLTQILPYTHYDILNSCGPDSSVCCQFDFRRMTQWGCGGPKPENIDGNNVKQKAAMFVEQLKRMAQMYESNVLLVMHGDDFRFELMSEWNQQHDNFVPLFAEINKGSEVSIKFGTFNDYFTALEKWYKDKKKSPAKISGDFFPYQCAMGSWWTGYFTTRPFYKKQGRLLHSQIHAADALLALKSRTLSVDEIKEYQKILTKSRRALLLFQHHDAITGTSKKSVMKDYSIQLHNAIIAVQDVMSKLNSGFQALEKPMDFDKIPAGALLKVYTGKPITISMFNQLPHPRAEVITLKVHSANVVALQNNTILNSQIEPLVVGGDIKAENYTMAIEVMLSPLARNTISLFLRSDLAERGVSAPSPSLANVFLPKAHEALGVKVPKEFKVKEVEVKDLTLENHRIKTMHRDDGMLKHNLAAYTGARGGAYIMASGVKAASELQLPGNRVMLIKGPVRDVIHILANSDVPQQTYALNNLTGSAGERIHWKVHMDITKKKNFELATQFTASLSQNTTWHYTDSVGLQLIRRTPHHGHDVGSDYYPMPTAAVMDDRVLRLTIASNVEHGAMFPRNGSVEIMIDRMLNQDDGKGLGIEDDGIPNDMKPTEIDFTILLEQVTEKKRNDHLSYNSLGSHLSLLSLLYPPVLQANAGDLEGKLATNSLPQLVLPCEYQLVSLRWLSSPSDDILMIIHRNGIDTGTASMVHCITHGFKGIIRQFLRDLGAKVVIRTNLSGVTMSTKELQTIDALDLDVAVMDFLVLKISI
ncbi:unnamed protein product, partial [Mesorhabditis spiculigera]